MEIVTEQQNISRLRWQCRRGMLELDEFLLCFLNHAYPELSEHQKEIFEQILKLPDPELLDYLLDQSRPTDTEVADVIQQIRSSARCQA